MWLAGLILTGLLLLIVLAARYNLRAARERRSDPRLAHVGHQIGLAEPSSAGAVWTAAAGIAGVGLPADRHRAVFSPVRRGISGNDRPDDPKVAQSVAAGLRGASGAQSPSWKRRPNPGADRRSTRRRRRVSSRPPAWSPRLAGVSVATLSQAELGDDVAQGLLGRG